MENDNFIKEIKKRKEQLESSWDCYTWDKWQKLVEDLINFYEKNSPK